MKGARKLKTNYLIRIETNLLNTEVLLFNAKSPSSNQILLLSPRLLDSLLISDSCVLHVGAEMYLEEHSLHLLPWILKVLLTQPFVAEISSVFPVPVLLHVLFPTENALSCINDL